MTVIVATATQKEMEAVLKGFNGRGRVGCQLPSQGQWCESPINEHQCLLAVTGVGPVNAALTLGRIMGECFGITGVLNLGIAGTFDPQACPLGSAVLAEREVWPEYGLRTAQGVDSRGIAFPLWGGTDPGVEQPLEQAIWDTVELSPAEDLRRIGLNCPKALTGTSITVAGVTGTAEHAAMFRDRYGALTENMEGFALALGCRQAGVPFVELRTVSNVVGSRAAADWKLDEAFVALGAVARSLFV
ncbi:MAG: futalosine hydrolase [Halodesulfovibrio sp.]